MKQLFVLDISLKIYFYYFCSITQISDKQTRASQVFDVISTNGAIFFFFGLHLPEWCHKSR